MVILNGQGIHIYEWVSTHLQDMLVSSGHGKNGSACASRLVYTGQCME